MQKDDFKAIVWKSRGITEARDPGLLPPKGLRKVRKQTVHNTMQHQGKHLSGMYNALLSATQSLMSLYFFICYGLTLKCPQRSTC